MIRNFVIPAAGKSSRFPNMKPKWMLTHPHGKLMIERVLEPYDFSTFDNVYIVLTEEQCQKYDADIILEQIYGDKIKLVILDSPTGSCPETIYEFLKQEKVTGHIIVKDCDCYVDFDKPDNYDNFIVGLSVHSTDNLNNLPAKSFIIRDEQKRIIQDIVEKKIVSEEICIGVYGCLVEDFLNSYIKLIHESNIPELYMSHIISNLIINSNKVFQYIEANDFIDWGTAEDWFKYTKKFKTYIFDIDGVLLNNVGRYGTKNWNNTFEPIEENIKVLKKLSDEGNELVFMTARDEEHLKEFKDYLIERKINYKTIISSCNHSQRIVINDYSNTNPYPSCNSISIKRNGTLGDYIK